MGNFRPLEFAICFLAALIAIAIGCCVSFKNYSALIIVGALIGLIATPALIGRFWLLGIAFCTSGFLYYTIGLPIVPLELCCCLSLYVVFFSFWTKKEATHLDKLSVLCIVCFLLILYLVIHFFWFKPVASPGAVRSMIRTYFDYGLPSLLVLIFTLWPPLIRQPRQPLIPLAILLILGNFLNTAMRFWQVFHAHGWGDPTSVPPFVIPGIVAMENVYLLRYNAPTLALLCAIFIFYLRPPPRLATRIFLAFMIVFSIGGAFLSGGRLAVLLIPLYVIVILIWRRKVGFLFSIVTACFCVVVLLNTFSGTLERNAPPIIMRSAYFFIFEKDPQAALSVDSSTEWREELVLRSFQEWMHTPWTIVFGRSIKAFNFNYDAALASGVGTESLEASVERGHTHCLVTDLLLPFGLIGAVLYLTVQFLSISILGGFLRAHGPTHRLHGYAFFLIIFYSYSLLYGLVGGGYDFFPQWLFLCFILFWAAPEPPPQHDLHHHPQLSAA